MNDRMGNNISKPIKKFNFSVQEQRLIREAKYIDRKIWKPTSMKKEISLIIKQTALYSLIPRLKLYPWASHIWIL